MGDLWPFHNVLTFFTNNHALVFLKAFTSDFQVHWGQHLLRPEFIESTYFLYRATLDPYYLQVGEKVLRSLQKHARVTCGYASIKVLLNITNCYLCYCTGYFFSYPWQIYDFTTMQPFSRMSALCKKKTEWTPSCWPKRSNTSTCSSPR